MYWPIIYESSQKLLSHYHMSDRQILTRHTRTDGGEDYADQDPGQEKGGPGSPCAPARAKQHPSLCFSSPGKQIKAPECHSHICVWVGWTYTTEKDNLARIKMGASTQEER